MPPGMMPLKIRLAAAIALVAVLALASILARPLAPTTAEVHAAPPLVVIDAGHGGYDGGAEWGGIKEKDINLEVAFALRDVLLASGYRVVLTRTGDYSLIEEDQPSMTKKRADMIRRLAVIEQNNADLIIIIHCNAISSSYWSGGQAFYQDDFEQGQFLAEDIQFFLTSFTDTHRQAKPGDFFLLRESTRIGSLVEVGFISNPQERELLQQREYQYKLALAIMLGISKNIHYPTEFD